MKLRNPFRRRSPEDLPVHRRLKTPDDRMTLVEHIAEFRLRLIRSLLAIAAGGTVVFLFYDPVQRFLIEPYYEVCRNRSADFQCTEGLILTDPLQGLATRMRVAAYLGLLIALPVVLWQLWRFITPALHQHEKRYAVPFVAASLVLFGFGGFIAWITWPQALTFLIGFSGSEVVPAFTPDNYVRIVLMMVIAFGFAFEFPVVLVALQLVGVVTPQALARARRYTVVGIFVFAAVITPSGDPISLLAMSLPMYLFYEAAILIGRVVARRRARRVATAGAAPAG